MGDLNVEHVRDIEPIRIDRVSNIAPVTIDSIRQIERIAPAAVHIKELNHIDPLTIESVRVDAVRNVEALRVDRLNVTRLPVVNLSVNQVPNVDLSVRRVPPVSIGLHQVFELPSDYIARARFLGFEVLRIQLQGQTQVIPRDCARREQSHSHERSFPDVAAVGNPAIPSRAEERNARVVARHVAPPCHMPPPSPPVYGQRPCAVQPPSRPALSFGPPRFGYTATGGPGVRPG